MISLTEDMMIGIALIDKQHKELIDRINTLTSMGVRSASKEETQKTVDFLEEYVIKHFGDEETLQKRYNYPKFESHKALHQEFINTFAKVKEEFAENGASLKFTLELNQRIISWIVKHVKNADMEFGKFYASLTNKK